MTSAILPADTAWMLTSTALVLLMTPAVGFFYGGFVRAKNALNTMMMCVGALAVVGISWALIGYGLAFAGTARWIGGWQYAFLNGVGLDAHGTIPHLLFLVFQGAFAIVTATLIAGAVAERMRFGAYLAFIGVWSIVVYAPLAHWVWGGGWLAHLGVLYYAGGTVVHIKATDSPTDARSTRSYRAPASSSRRIWCCWRWASQARCRADSSTVSPLK